jgi:hypothetical protein
MKTVVDRSWTWHVRKYRRNTYDESERNITLTDIS